MEIRKNYNHTKIEAKWQKKWIEDKIFSPDLKTSNKPFYNLMMYPYPSAEGMHVGNMMAFTGADIYGRFKRMNGYSVFEPIGLDGFGIHSENYAIEIGEHPAEVTKRTEKNFYKQLKATGNAFDWTKTLETYDPDYYRWTQWIFIQMFKAGMAYKGVARVNWCPSCKTVLADEQVINGVCERCKNEVVRKEMSSWYFRITKYVDRLLSNLDKIDWPKKISIAQRNWIGKKEGIDIKYEIKGERASITCFTTRPDTNFGATFIVTSPEYAQKHLLKYIPKRNKDKVQKYIKRALNKTEQQRQEESKEKSGIFTGLYAINKLNDYQMPVWVSDFVLANVGSGAVVGVPGHDKRDFEFAKKFDLEVIRVVVGPDEDKSEIKKIKQVNEDNGVMINSDFLNGMKVDMAIKTMISHLESKGWGERVTTYHLRDWLISRQRYWGPPIPMIYCKACKEKRKGERKELPGWYTTPINELPVILPEINEYKPKGDGTSPLSNAPSDWKETRCPGCKATAQRELDVSDTFLDSSWYFLAYPNLETDEWKSNKTPFNKEMAKKWLPVDAYIGGAEHAVLHLLYARFVTMALSDMEILEFEEPFPFLFGHGLLIKDGAKMSKSRGNVVIPDKYISKFGADALRMYLMFLGPYSAGGDFKDTGIEGMRRFIVRVWKLETKTKYEEKEDNNLDLIEHKTIKKVTEDLESFKYNTAISAIMEYVNVLRGRKKLFRGKILTLMKLIAPFAPHMAEEMWECMGEKYSIHITEWPKYDPKKIVEDSLFFVIQVNGNLRATIKVDATEAKNKEKMIIKAKGNKNTAAWLTKGKIIKTIFVPGKLINFVVKS